MSHSFRSRIRWSYICSKPSPPSNWARTSGIPSAHIKAGRKGAMNRNMLIVGISSMLMIVSQMAWADYMVTSEITGNDCWGIGIKSCSTVKVVAFKKGGELYEMPTSFGTVSKYSEDTGR